MAPIQAIVEKELKALKEEKGYQIIINQPFKTNEYPHILYAEVEVPDITMDLIARLNR